MRGRMMRDSDLLTACIEISGCHLVKLLRCLPVVDAGKIRLRTWFAAFDDVAGIAGAGIVTGTLGKSDWTVL